MRSNGYFWASGENRTATVHAPYHVTYAYGQILSTYLKSLTPICPLLRGYDDL